MTVSRQEAVKLILDSIKPLETIDLPLTEALGYIVGDSVYASTDIPRFDRSAMDGYAVCSKDIANATNEDPVELKVVGQIHPSTAKLSPLAAGQAVRIMTGGPIPPRADAVVKEEDARYSAGFIELRAAVPPFEYVSKQGENMKRGSLVVEAGDLITPAVLGILATLQTREVPVTRRPRVCVLAVGNELVDINDRREDHKIVASNIYMLSAMIKEHGGHVNCSKISRNDKNAIRKDIGEGLKSDILITTGGTSNAHSDLTRALIGEIGIDLKFAGVSMRPGKGTSFGFYDGKPVLSLPGKPSAVYVAFYVLVLPALLRLMGFKIERMPSIKAILEQDIKKRPGTDHLVQGLVREEDSRYRVLPLVGPEVSIFSAMKRANGLIVVRRSDKSRLSKGEAVSVQLLNHAQNAFFQRPTAHHGQESVAPPIVSIVGKSNAGKTTLLERLVPELKARGYSIGTIKHDVHGFDIDHEGKDSWRHKHAGACSVAISSPKKVAVIKDVEAEETLDGLASKYFQDADIILTEGYKKQHKPKIEVFRSQVHDKPLCRKDDSLVALLSDIPLDLGVPRFELDDIKGLADLVEERFLAKPSI
jgi:molybdopterin molybdotransferase